jgi:hypothetical protein
MPNASFDAHSFKFATLSAQHGPTVSFFAQSESFARARSELCNLHCRPQLLRRKPHQKYKRNNDDEYDNDDLVIALINKFHQTNYIQQVIDADEVTI